MSDWQIDHADCLDWYPRWPADCFDLTLGSPQYEDQRLYLENGEDLGLALNTEEWVELMVQVYKEALRCTRGLVAFVVEGKTDDFSYTASPMLLMARLVAEGITLRKPPIYVRNGIPGSGGNRHQHQGAGGSADWLRNDWELIVCATRGGKLPWADTLAMGHPPKCEPGGDPSHRRRDGTRVGQWGNPPSSCGMRADGSHIKPGPAMGGATRGSKGGDAVNGNAYVPPAVCNPGNVIREKLTETEVLGADHVSNVIDCGAVGGGNMGDRICHENEAPFPEELAEFFIRSFCPPGGVVCDPFSGSGTTAKMAVALGRRFRGCDVRKSQVELTRKRLAHVQQHLAFG